MRTTIKEQLETYAQYIKSLPLEELETRLAMAKTFGDKEYVEMIEKVIANIRSK